MLKLSTGYQQAVQNPFLAEFSNVFKTRIVEENHLVRKSFEWAHLGQRIAEWLSQYAARDGSEDNAGRFFGEYLKGLGHVVNVACLKSVLSKQSFREKVQLESALKYMTRVDETMKRIFAEVEENNYGHYFLFSENVADSLRQGIDMPTDKLLSAVTLELASGRCEETAGKAKNLFNTQLTLHTCQLLGRSDPSAFSLRGTMAEQQTRKVFDDVCQLVRESGVLAEGAADRLAMVGEGQCTVIEGKEIESWITEQVRSHDIPMDAAAETLGAVFDEARSFYLKQVKERMDGLNGKEIGVTSDELSVFPVQNYYPQAGGVKFVIDGRALNEFRQQVCPGVKPIQFPRVVVAKLPRDPLSPLEETPISSSTVIKVLECVRDSLANRENVLLDTAICQLQVIVSRFEADAVRKRVASP